MNNEVAPNMVNFKDGGIASGSKCFAADGFFPGYYKQKNKLVFIARETRWLGSDYIKTVIGFF